ncbi:MAG: hypothetical protein PHW00_05265, partial [Clostridia bacterium]|nr:hypothetical protein [Clostridia bacterium]
MIKKSKILGIAIILLLLFSSLVLSACGGLAIGTKSIEINQDTIPVSFTQGNIDDLSAITIIVTPLIGKPHEVSLTTDMLSDSDIAKLSIIGTHTITVTHKGKTCTLTVVVTTDIHTHTYGEWTLTLAPSCTTVGSEKRVCECGYEETREIAALGHDYATEFTIDTQATCTIVGSKSHHCSRCDSTTDVTEIPATGHT